MYAHLGKVIDRVVAGSLFHWTFVVFAVLRSVEHPYNSIQRSDTNYVEISTASSCWLAFRLKNPKMLADLWRSRPKCPVIWMNLDESEGMWKALAAPALDVCF